MRPLPQENSHEKVTALAELEPREPARCADSAVRVVKTLQCQLAAPFITKLTRQTMSELLFNAIRDQRYSRGVFLQHPRRILIRSGLREASAGRQFHIRSLHAKLIP